MLPFKVKNPGSHKEATKNSLQLYSFLNVLYADTLCQSFRRSQTVVTGFKAFIYNTENSQK